MVDVYKRQVVVRLTEIRTLLGLVVGYHIFVFSLSLSWPLMIIHHLSHSRSPVSYTHLDETREADLLLHVVDISHPDFEEQIQVVENTLKELDCADKPSMIIFNKIDNYS